MRVGREEKPCALEFLVLFTRLELEKQVCFAFSQDFYKTSSDF